MKTTIFVTVIGLAAAALVFPQPSSWEEDGLQGKVKSVAVERAEVLQKAGAASEARRRPVQTAWYTPAGEKTEELHFSSSGLLLWTFHFAYDSPGKRTSTECRLADGQTSLKLVYTYSAAGVKSTSATYGPDGSLQEQSVYAYDARGRNIEIEHFASDGSSLGKWVYSYDSNGHPREWIAYDSNAAISEDSAYTYDSEGRLRVSEQYGATNVLERRSTYDSQGNETEAEKYSADGALVWKRQYEYSLDAAGNWIRKVTKELQGKGPYAAVEVEYRSIEYY